MFLLYFIQNKDLFFLTFSFRDQPRTVVISSSASVSSLDMGDNKKQAIDILPLIPPKRAGSKQKSEMRPEPEEIYKLLRSYSEYYPLARFIDEKEQQEQENIGLQKGIKTDIHFFQKHKLRPGYPLTPLGPDQSRTGQFFLKRRFLNILNA